MGEEMEPIFVLTKNGTDEGKSREGERVSEDVSSFCLLRMINDNLRMWIIRREK